MKKRKIFIPLLVLLVMTSLAIAGNYSGWFAGKETRIEQPDAIEEYRRLYERYTRPDSIVHIKGTITLHDGENPSSTQEQSSFLFLKKGQQFYSQLSHLQTFSNGQLIIQLDTVDKTISVLPGNTTGASLPEGMGQPSFGVLFNDTAGFRIAATVAGDQQERILSCQSDVNPDIRRFRLVYNSATYQLRQAEIEWWKDALLTDSSENKVWITRINYQELPGKEWKIDEMINAIITVSKNGIEPTPRYKEYTIHDLTAEALFYEDIEQH